MLYFWRVLMLAFHSLGRNVFRSALTTLGIVIGVAAVIAMVEIGQGASTAVQQTILSMGANNILIMPGTATSGGVSFGGGSGVNLTPADVDALSMPDRCPAVEAVAPLVRARTQVVYGNKNWVPIYIYGTTPAYLDIRDWEDLTEGNPFTIYDVNGMREVCLIGSTVARELFEGESPVGQQVRINNRPFTVVGVLSSKGANMTGLDQDDIVLAPWTTIKFKVVGQSSTTANQSAAVASSASSLDKVNTLSQLYPGSVSVYPVPSAIQMADTPVVAKFTNIDQMLLKARSAERVEAAIRQIKDVLRERHRLRLSSTVGSEAWNSRDLKSRPH